MNKKYEVVLNKNPIGRDTVVYLQARNQAEARQEAFDTYGRTNVKSVEAYFV